MRGQLKEYINHALSLPHILTSSHFHNLVTVSHWRQIYSLSSHIAYNSLAFVLYKTSQASGATSSQAWLLILMIPIHRRRMQMPPTSMAAL